ncbi:MAG: DUF799 family lipoprotein [Oligoflexia bacterium]|nr:DUF799 family lipoprotein [Oligoflexia bacterium]
MKLLLVFLSMLWLAGCSAKYSSKLDFNPTEPLRVAVLPFAQVDKQGQIVESEGDLGIDRVGLVSQHLGESPAEFLRKAVQKELGKSGLDVLSAGLVDSEFSHHGYAFPDLKPDLKKIFASNPKDLCSHLLNCDAVIYGRVKKWDRGYYAIESVNTVALDLQMISVKDGRVLFTTSGEDSESRGLTKGPTGFSDLVIEPVRGLDSEIIADLSRRLVTKMLAPLKVESRPEYLKSQAPAIWAAAHDARDGRVALKKPLTVLAFGPSGMNASFSIGKAIQNIPMLEEQEMHYFGQYYPLPGDRIDRQPVIVSVADKYGRVTSQELGNGPVSVN